MSVPTNESQADVVVVGCGIIGASVAWRAAATGRSVTVLDPEPGDGATHAAAGMLAPVSEATFGEYPLLRLNVASNEMWPTFAAELEAETGGSVGLRRTGTLGVAYDDGDRRRLLRMLALQQEWGLQAEEITVAQARDHEPLLGPRVAGATWVTGDHQVDPRAVNRALLQGLAQRGVGVVRERAVEVVCSADGSQVRGVRDESGAVHAADDVVLAAGWATRELIDRLDGTSVPTRPVKGQVLRLRPGPSMQTPQLGHVVRGLVQDRSVYVVPRADGEVVIGASSEEQPDDREITVGATFALLRDARALVPGIDELAMTDMTARARPGSPDNLPIIGPVGPSGLVVATGHYRDGILLAPLTAEAVCAVLDGGGQAVDLGAADPNRFMTTQEMVVSAQ